jgi:hypothetical protein
VQALIERYREAGLNDISTISTLAGGTDAEREFNRGKCARACFAGSLDCSRDRRLSPRFPRELAILTSIGDGHADRQHLFPGLKVVDLSGFIAGPSAAVILSDFGADVIKVEPPAATPGRHGHQIPPRSRWQGTLSVASANRNKRSITLDLKSPSASQVLEEARQMGGRVRRQHPASCTQRS